VKRSLTGGGSRRFILFWSVLNVVEDDACFFGFFLMLAIPV